MTKNIFPHFTKEFVQKLGTHSNLISNDALDEKWEMLTLFKIGKKSVFSFHRPRPKPLEMTLNKFIHKPIYLDSDVRVLVKDFQNFKLDSFSLEAGVEVQPVEGQAKASKENKVTASPVTLMSKTIRQDDLSDLIMTPKKIKLKEGAEETVKLLQGEKLAFVRQIVYSTADVNVKSKTSTKCSFKAKIYSIITGCAEGERTEVTTLNVPKESIYAFALKEITLEDGYLKISPEYTMTPFCGSLKSEEFIMVDKIKTAAKVLEALADVPGSTRMDLLKKLTEILDDRKALAVLEDTLYEYRQGKHQRPQSEAVASFMDVLDFSKASSNFTNAVQKLVCALQELPDNTAALLAKSGSETLNCIIQLIDGVQEGQAKLPESAPLPLQEKGELHWVAMFLIAASNLKGLKKNWDDTEISPEGLVELLYISVDGLSRMQAGVRS